MRAVCSPNGGCPSEGLPAGSELTQGMESVSAGEPLSSTSFKTESEASSPLWDVEQVGVEMISSPGLLDVP